MNKLQIIGVDGINGSGKTSLIKKLMSNTLLKDKFIFTTRREPASPYVEEMYSIINQFKESMEPLGLFVKDLQYRYSVMPSDKIIISDRTFRSAEIFYNAVSELSKIQDAELYHKIINLAEQYKPVLNIVLQAKIDETRKRIWKERQKFKPIEEIGFQILCAKGFERLVTLDNTLNINTNGISEKEVYNSVIKKINSLNLKLLQ